MSNSNAEAIRGFLRAMALVLGPTIALKPASHTVRDWLSNVILWGILVICARHGWAGAAKAVQS